MTPDDRRNERADAAACPFAGPVHELRRAPNGCPVGEAAASFDPFAPEYMEAPADYLRWAREREPVFYSPKIGYWIVTRYDDVKAVFQDNLLFSPSIALEKITPATPEVTETLKRHGFAMGRTMVNEDEPDHMARRRLLMDAFKPERLLGYESKVRALARHYMDRFVDRGRADLVQEMFAEVPLAIALAFLGVPDDEAAELRRFAVAHTLNTWGRPTPQQQIEIAENVGRFWQTAQRILERMMCDPGGEGWMYDTIRQHRAHPDVVPESYLRSMMMAILAAAHETTSNATANAFMTLLGRREAWEAICADPTLIPNAVEECLRVAGSIIAWRRIATADAQVGGVRIPAGGRLLLVMASANVDAGHFENPDEVDVYRDIASEHLTFGYGAHQCMGKNIGRMQVRIFLEEFVRRLPHMRLVDGQTFDFLPNTSFRGPSELWVEWDPALNPENRGRNAPPPAAPFYVGPPSRDRIARTVVVREKAYEGDDLYRFGLGDPDGRDLPAWTPGAHVDLILDGVRRKYSLCGDPTDRSLLEVVIQREAGGRGGSVRLCDGLQPGDTLRLSGPKNTFRLDESAERYVLIAGGIGITPIAAMADRLARLGKDYALHYAGRSTTRMALMRRLCRTHGARMSVYPKDEGTRMDLATLLAAVDAGTRVYACGPARLIEALEGMAERWPTHVLRYEHFAAVTARSDPEGDRPFVAELKDSGLDIEVPAGVTLLHALQAAGIDVPNDCGEGLCGTCEVAVLSGTVDHRDAVLDRAERRSNGRMMACCSRSAGPRITLAL